MTYGRSWINPGPYQKPVLEAGDWLLEARRAESERDGVRYALLGIAERLSDINVTLGLLLDILEPPRENP